MAKFSSRMFLSVMLLTLAHPSQLLSAAPTGWQPECRVRDVTRLDWQFAAGSESRLPGNYSTRQQAYQLFVPKKYSDKKAWPLLVFLSPGDNPTGWGLWRKPCEDSGWIFAAPHGIGLRCPVGQRYRAVLDVVDQVRRDYAIDPEAIYLCGEGAAASLAGSIAFALPDHFAGVIAFSGEVSLPRHAYLRQRVRERLSVALVAEKTDPIALRQRYLTMPLLETFRVRHKTWSGIAIADLKDVQQWLTEDIKRRQKDRLALGELGGSHPSRRTLVNAVLNRVKETKKDPTAQVHSAMLLEWVIARGGNLLTVEHAKKALTDLRTNPEIVRLVDQRKKSEELALLRTEVIGRERLGEVEQAITVCNRLVGKAEGAELNWARDQAMKLAERLRNKPWIGFRLSGDTTVVRSVSENGPAHKAGLLSGDKIEAIGKREVKNASEIRRELDTRRSGEEVSLRYLRDGKRITCKVKLSGHVAEKE